ncbi:hypothetical protein B0H13DRAFT_1922190 [Mycena leptocephala]|nr:hypothetical protein B0H13DRAFT_1922190 [Mycena leptocephala]
MALNQALPPLLEYYRTTQTYRTFSGMELNRSIQTYHLIGRGPIPFTAHIPSILPQPCDHHLEAYFIVESFVFRLQYSLSLVFEALEHFKHFDDPGLKYDIPKGQMFCETAISLALSTQNTKMQSCALAFLAWIKWTTGDYFTAQLYAKETQRLARISADLYQEAQALHIAQTYKLKSEYVKACSIHLRILQETSVAQDFYVYAFALLNVAEIDVSIGAPKEDVQSLYEKARGIFNTAGHVQEITICWGAPNWMSGWTTVFLVHSVQRREKLGIHKALQFLGDVFLAQDDEHTAINLFTVALEGFTYMDVHHSRAECMLRLGDISKGHGDLLKAVELWETARPLFERSLQAKQVENIDQRLAGIGEDVLEQHSKNSVHLAELTTPSGIVDRSTIFLILKTWKGWA